MNWVLVCVLAILLIFGYAGWKKGILRIVLSLASVVLSIVAMVIISPVVGKIIREHTPLYDSIENKVYNTILKDDEINNAADITIGAGAENISAYEQDSQELISYVNSVIQEINLPPVIQEQINKSEAGLEDLNISGSMNTIKDQVVALFATRLSDVIYNIIIHVVVLVVVFILLRLVVATTDIIGRLPVLKQANHITGCIVGIIEGMVIIWMLFAITSVFAYTDYGASIISCINDNKILTWINDNNLILQYFVGNK